MQSILKKGNQFLLAGSMYAYYKYIIQNRRLKRQLSCRYCCFI